MPHHDSLRALIQALHLPAGYREQADRYLQPLAAQIAARCGDRMWVVGINGAQGSGKSTLARVLACLLRQYGLHAAVLSLDDFYLPGRARASLAAGVHPLLRTRGVPGTHDVQQGERLFLRLGRMGATDCIRLPRFDKGRDEPCDETSRPLWQGKVDVLIFEGWCVGTPAQPEAELQQPVNALEAEQDRHGRWRAYVNRRLATDYQHWFSCLDMLLYLQVPSMQDAFRWRLRQEQQLPPDRRMTPVQLQGFMQHFERLTLHAMRQLPHGADIVLTLDAAQRITRVRKQSLWRWAKGREPGMLAMAVADFYAVQAAGVVRVRVEGDACYIVGEHQTGSGTAYTREEIEQAAMATVLEVEYVTGPAGK